MITTQIYSPTSPLSANVPLSVEKVPKEPRRYEKILKDLEEWSEIARTKKGRCIPESQEEDLFYFSQTLCNHVVTDLQSSLHPGLDPRPEILKGLSQESELYICQDEENSLQGVMTISRPQIDELTITHLLTHPKNIKSSLNKNSRIRGAGSSLLQHAIKLISEENKTRLTISAPNQTSLPFYKIYGFKPDPEMPCNLVYRINDLAGKTL